MQLTFYDIPFFLLFFLFTAFALFLLFNKKGNRLSNCLLGSFFAAFGLSSIDGYLLYRDIYQQFPNAAFWINGVPALYGPLLYLYTKSILFKDFKLQWKHLGHASLFLVVFFVFVGIYHLQSTNFQLTFLKHAKTYSGIEVLLGSSLLVIQMGIYLFLSFRHIHQYKQRIEQQYSEVPNQQIAWLRFNLISFTSIYFVLLFYQIARFSIWDGQLNMTAIMLIDILFLVFILAILYRALHNSAVFTTVKEAETKSKKYAYSILSDTDKQQYFQQLLALMESEKPWLNPKLTIGELAKNMQLAPKTLSQVINETTGQSFFDFINRRRIAAAQHLLAHPTDEKMTITEIMYEVGFNSKSSFNTAFKKYVGMTPSVFKRQ